MKARIGKLLAEKIPGDREEQANLLWRKKLLVSTCWNRKTKNVRSCKREMEKKSYGEISLSMDTRRSRAHNLCETEAAYTTEVHTMAFGQVNEFNLTEKEYRFR